MFISCGGENSGSSDSGNSSSAEASSFNNPSSSEGSSSSSSTNPSSSASSSASFSPKPSSTHVSSPEIYSFKTDKDSTEWGESTDVVFTARFTGGTGTVLPGGKIIKSGTPLTLSVVSPSKYTLSVKNSAGETVTEEINISGYLEGTYKYNLYGSYPITAHFSFFSTGIGNFSWSRKFPTTIDSWLGTFKYTINKDKTVDLYWQKGNRAGTHSPIQEIGAGYVIFEGSKYLKQ
jgi:hypothetical protein